MRAVRSTSDLSKVRPVCILYGGHDRLPARCPINFLRRSAVPTPYYEQSHKWFRNLAIAETLVELLRPHRDGWLKALEKRGKEELEAIRAARAGGDVRSSS